MKNCSKCGLSKPINEYYARKSLSGGYYSVCKSCCKAKNAEYYKRNREKIKAEMRERRASIPETERSKINRERHLKNRDANLQRMKAYRQKTKEAWNKKQVDRYHSDPMFRLRVNLTNRANKVFDRSGMPKTGRTRDLIGCDWEHLKLHIESKFDEGMTWENRSEWHIDHIVPLSSAKTREEMERLCHYTNLQPLWAQENLAKGARLDYEKKA